MQYQRIAVALITLGGFALMSGELSAQGRGSAGKGKAATQGNAQAQGAANKGGRPATPAKAADQVESEAQVEAALERSQRSPRATGSGVAPARTDGTPGNGAGQGRNAAGGEGNSAGRQGPPFRPPGWDKGKKTGWGDSNVPPGLAKQGGAGAGAQPTLGDAARQNRNRRASRSSDGTSSEPVTGGTPAGATTPNAPAPGATSTPQSPEPKPSSRGGERKTPKADSAPRTTTPPVAPAKRGKD